ncbi:MAG: hypothetical protein QXT77_09115 [Candidatus Methanomethylicaceae archaeon]
MIKEIASAVGGDLVGAGISGAFNAREARKNRKWQEEMSNTAYQRAASDLEKAGLNRVLALGSPAATPSGATASISAPPLGKTGVAAASAKQAISQSQAQEGLLKEQTRLTGIQADTENVKKALYVTLQPYIDDIVKAFQAGAGNAGNPLKNMVSGAKDAISIDSPNAKVPDALTAKGQQGKTPEEVKRATEAHMKTLSTSDRVKFIWNMLLEHF